MTDEREAIARCFDTSSLVETSMALQAISQPVVVRAAVAALRALLADAEPDPEIDRSHLDRGRLLADAIDAWLAKPTDETLALVRTRTGGTEAVWNELAGDTGQPEPVLAAATNTGWCVIHPHQRFNLTPALGEAAKRMGDERVLAAVRNALAPSLQRR